MNNQKKLSKVKQILALFLAVVLAVPSIPISAYAAPEDTAVIETVTAETEETETETESDQGTELTQETEETVVEESSVVE